MSEHDFLVGEPTGLPQEAFGAEVVDSCTHTALDHFFESKNAAMGPLLNAPGIAMLYSEDALLEVEMPGPNGPLKTTCTGKAEIQGFFESLAKLMLSMFNAETDRSITGRSATWHGIVSGVNAGTRERAELNAIIKLEFDEHDHVTHENARFTLRTGP